MHGLFVRKGPGQKCVCVCVRQGRRGCACVRLRMWVVAPSETLALAEPMLGLLKRSPGDGAFEVPVWSSNPAPAERTWGGLGWEMGNLLLKGLLGGLGGWKWADTPVNTALGWSERPMPPVPTCDIPFDHQLTVHATWPAESRTLPSPIPVNKILFTSTGSLNSGSAVSWGDWEYLGNKVCS